MSDIFDCVQLPTPSTSFQRHCTRAAAGPPPRYENFRPPAECSANFSSGLSNYLAHCGESSAILEASASLESVADAEEESSPRHRVVQKAASSDCALPTRRSKQSRNVLLRKWKRLRLALAGAVPPSPTFRTVSSVHAADDEIPSRKPSALHDQLSTRDVLRYPQCKPIGVASECTGSH
ncbi:hypothetical protein QR680_005537 [Steinernema hermaphroditum]|uniref:Uncharacterized protein n=1 Tax=Steinernema hermaphroditum TaxID=289476 RepID=A0AA39HTN3_9BILA|nr:hypothetical protein QR680_005537 [Steinernema hermaphroditum]